MVVPSPGAAPPPGGPSSPGGSLVDVGGHRIRRNTLWNLIGQGGPLLIALWAIPILMREMGVGAFGLLGLVWAMITILGDFGLGRAGTRYTAEALGAGRAGRARQILSRVALGQFLIGAIGGALFLALIPRMVSLFQMEPAVAVAALSGFRWVAFALPVFLLTAVLRGGLEAAQAFGVLNTIRGVGNVFVYLLPVFVIRAGGSVVDVVAVTVAVRVLMAVGFGVALLRELARFGGEDAVPVMRSVPGRSGVVAFGVWTSISTVVSPVLVYIDRFLLAGIVGLDAVGRYTAPFEAITRVLLVPAAVAGTVFPAVASLKGAGGIQSLRRLFGGATRGVALAVVPIALLTILLAGPAVRLWLGADVTPDVIAVVRLLAIGMAANALAYIPFSVVQGLGRADLTGIFHLIELPIHLALAFWLISGWGLVGAAIAWSIRATLDSTLLFLAAGWLLRRESDPVPAGAAP